MENNLKVLVVEDEPLLLEAIGDKLQKVGIDGILCSSGEKALEHMSSDVEIPDAIWLDYYLKDMNGLAFMDKVRQNAKWQDIPVIVVSNSANAQKVNTMLALGVKKYLLKAEYRLEDIVDIIRQLKTD